jgi:hypothetical protein
MLARLLVLVAVILLPLGTAKAASDDCTSWAIPSCWAHTLQTLIDTGKDIPDALKRSGDQALAGVYQTSQNLGAVASQAGNGLKQVYTTLLESHDKVCADDDLFFMEAVTVIAAGIFAVEVSMTGGLSGGAGALALKGLLISQSPKLMSKLHERLCGSAFTKADPTLVTQVETIIDKALAGK